MTTSAGGEWVSTLAKGTSVLDMPIGGVHDVSHPGEGVDAILPYDTMLQRVGTADWFGEVRFMTGTSGGAGLGFSVHAEDAEAWVQLCRDFIIEGGRSIRELAAELPLRLRLHVDGHQAKFTPGQGWCGYLALMQAQYLGQGYQLREVQTAVSEDMEDLQDRITHFLDTIMTEDTTDKLSQVRDRVTTPLTALEPALWFESDDNVQLGTVGPVAWYTQEQGKFYLHRASVLQGPLRYTDVAEVVDSAAIGFSQGHFFICSGRAKAKGFEEQFLHFVTDTVKKVRTMGAVVISSRINEIQRKRDTIALVRSSDAEPTHLLISTIPYDVRMDAAGTHRHLVAVIGNQDRVLIRPTCSTDANGIVPVDLQDVSGTFGIVLECKRTTGCTPLVTHFVVTATAEGPREQLRNYHCQVLTTAEATLLVGPKRVVAVFRGCTRLDAVDDLYRSAVLQILERQQVQGCVVVVEQIQQLMSTNPRSLRETIIVVYGEHGFVEDIEVKRRQLGFTAARKRLQLEYRGLRFEVYSDTPACKGHLIAPWVLKGRARYATISNIALDTTDEVITGAIFAAFGVMTVDFWITRITGPSKLVTVGLTDDFDLNAVETAPLIAIQAKQKVFRFLDFEIPTMRKKETEVLFGVGEMSPRSATSGSSTSSLSNTSRSTRHPDDNHGTAGGRDRRRSNTSRLKYGL